MDCGDARMSTPSVIRHPLFPATAAAIAGFLLPFQTVWILRSGGLGGVPWPLATIGIYAGDVVLAGAAVVGIVRRWRTDRRSFIIAAVFFALLATANTFASADTPLSAIGWMRIGAFLLAVAGIPAWSASARRGFRSGFLLAMCVHALLGIAQFVMQSVFASTFLGTAFHAAWVRGDAVVVTAGERWLRAYGGFPHPNILGIAMLIAMMVLATMPIRSFLIRHSFCVIFAFALLLSFSRAALLGFLILLGAFVIRRATRNLALVGAAVVVITMVATWSLWVPRVTVSGVTEARSLTERRDAVTTALAFSAIPPFLGVGLHAMPQARYAFAREMAGDGTGDPYTMQPAHSVPLLAIAEIGWLGFGLFLLILMYLFPISSLAMGHWSFVLPLCPPFLLDHALWSLPIGILLLLALVVSGMGWPEPPAASRVPTPP